MIMAKLTKAQLAFLTESSREGGAHCIDRYAPMHTLRDRELVSVTVGKYGNCHVKITDAGRAALASIPDERAPPQPSTGRLAVEVEYWLGVIGDRLGPDRRFSDTASDLLTVLRGQ
jgi:hypothetical protein